MHQNHPHHCKQSRYADFSIYEYNNHYNKSLVAHWVPTSSPAKTKTLMLEKEKLVGWSIQSYHFLCNFWFDQLVPFQGRVFQTYGSADLGNGSHILGRPHLGADRTNWPTQMQILGKRLADISIRLGSM